MLQITVETHSDIRLMTQDGDCSSNVTTPWSLASTGARPWDGADDVMKCAYLMREALEQPETLQITHNSNLQLSEHRRFSINLLVVSLCSLVPNNREKVVRVTATSGFQFARNVWQMFLILRIPVENPNSVE